MTNPTSAPSKARRKPLMLAVAVMAGLLTAASFVYLKSTPAAVAPASAAVAIEASAVSSAEPAALDALFEQVDGKVAGVSVGPADAKASYYVFFDPQCPHCTVLFRELEPLSTVARFTWVPVGILSKKSVQQGVALLSATDPVATLKSHEASMASKTGGLPIPATIDQAALTKMKANTELFGRLHQDSVPLLIGVNPKTGKTVTHMGSARETDMAALLGVDGV